MYSFIPALLKDRDVNCTKGYTNLQEKIMVLIPKNSESNYKIKESRVSAEYRTEHHKTNKATQISMTVSSHSIPPNRGFLRKFLPKKIFNEGTEWRSQGNFVPIYWAFHPSISNTKTAQRHWLHQWPLKE